MVNEKGQCFQRLLTKKMREEGREDCLWTHGGSWREYERKKIDEKEKDAFKLLAC